MKDSWKYVSIGNNIKVLIFVLISFAFLFVPFAITEEELIFTFSKLPIIGDGQMVTTAEIATDYFGLLIPSLGESITSLVKSLFGIAYTVFMGILVADVLFCLLLSIFRVNALRIIIKILSIFCGFIMIIFAVLNLVYVVGFFNASGMYEIGFFDMIKTSGVIPAFAFFILGIIYAIKQFKWYSRP